MQVQDCRALGQIVRAQRKAQKLTQVDAAALCGVGVRFLHDLERGKPTVHLGKVFDVLETLGLRVHLDDGQDPT